MSKDSKSRKEIEQTIRQKVAHQYNERIDNLKSQLSDLRKELESERSKRIQLEHENSELKEKLCTQDDWIERMQEFVNMPDDMRKKEFEKMKMDQESLIKFKQFMESPIIRMYQHLFNL